VEKFVKIEKNTVQETLMLPLYGKVHCMKIWPDEFHDTDCIRIKEMIDYDFSELEQKFTGLYGKIASLSAGCRQFALAEEIRRYLSSHPKAVVVLMGCGLDTVGHQADNGQCRYINIDYPNVIQVREKLLPSNEREKNIAYDLNDVQWFDEIDYRQEDGAIFVASGVFMYFRKDDLAKLLNSMAEHFPNAALTFDAQNAKGAAMDLKALKDSGIDISLNFSLEKKEAEATLRKMCPAIKTVKVSGMIYPYKNPKPFGILFSLMSRYGDKGLCQIETITF